eukprot:scaffold9328_cov84-Isochrysis_galbana.AAC.1
MGAATSATPSPRAGPGPAWFCLDPGAAGFSFWPGPAGLCIRRAARRQRVAAGANRSAGAAGAVPDVCIPGGEGATQPAGRRNGLARLRLTHRAQSSAIGGAASPAVSPPAARGPALAPPPGVSTPAAAWSMRAARRAASATSHESMYRRGIP